MAAVACTNAPKADEKACENDANKTTFNAQHFPKQGVDVNAFSGGVQHIGVPTANVQGTVEFYKTLGFEEVMRRTVTGDRDFAFMKLGEPAHRGYSHGGTRHAGWCCGSLVPGREAD